MDASAALTAGLSLMLYGMGFVFSFLVLLVLATSLLSRLIDRYFPQTPPAASCPAPGRKPESPVAEDGSLLAVLTAAVHRYRTR